MVRYCKYFIGRPKLRFLVVSVLSPIILGAAICKGILEGIKDIRHALSYSVKEVLGDKKRVDREGV